MDKCYYIVCNRYAGDNCVRFWKPDCVGYTFNILHAALFDASDFPDLLIYDKDKPFENMYVDFLVHWQDVQHLGVLTNVVLKP